MIDQRSEIHTAAFRIINELKPVGPPIRNALGDSRRDVSREVERASDHGVPRLGQVGAGRPGMSWQPIEKIESTPGNGAAPSWEEANGDGRTVFGRAAELLKAVMREDCRFWRLTV